MATTERITTAEQLFEAPGLGPCELVRGELIMAAPAGGGHGRIELKLGAADTLTGGDVLPGFSLPLREIFPS